MLDHFFSTAAICCDLSLCVGIATAVSLLLFKYNNIILKACYYTPVTKRLIDLYCIGIMSKTEINNTIIIVRIIIKYGSVFRFLCYLFMYIHLKLMVFFLHFMYFFFFITEIEPFYLPFSHLFSQFIFIIIAFECIIYCRIQKV